jgi:hypothetical protein
VSRQGAGKPLSANDRIKPGGEDWCVRARNPAPGFAATLGSRVNSLLRVKIAEAGGCDDEGLPDVSGDHEILGDGLRFTPHFPFESGVPFRAIFDLRALGQPGLAAIHTLEFRFEEK